MIRKQNRLATAFPGLYWLISVFQILPFKSAIMIRNQNRTELNGMLMTFLTGLNILIINAGYTADQKWYWALAVTIPALVLAVLNYRRK